MLKVFPVCPTGHWPADDWSLKGLQGSTCVTVYLPHNADKSI